MLLSLPDPQPRIEAIDLAEMRRVLERPPRRVQDKLQLAEGRLRRDEVVDKLERGGAMEASGRRLPDRADALFQRLLRKLLEGATGLPFELGLRRFIAPCLDLVLCVFAQKRMRGGLWRGRAFIVVIVAHGLLPFHAPSPEKDVTPGAHFDWNTGWRSLCSAAHE